MHGLSETEKDSRRGRNEPREDRCKPGAADNSRPTAEACAQSSSHLQLPEWESANFSPLFMAYSYP